MVYRGRRFFPIACICSFFLGFESGGFQYSLLKIATELNISGVQNGILVAAQYSAIMVMPVLFGKIADRVGKRRILFFFCLVFCLGCLGISVFPGYVFALGSVFVIGAGYSVCESMSAAILADEGSGKSGQLLSYAQCLFSLGAVLSPQYLRFVERAAGWSWESLFMTCGAAFFGVALVLRPCSHGDDFLKKTVSMAKDSGGKQRIKGRFLLLIFAMFVYGGMEVGISYYIDTYLRSVLQMAEQTADVISMFWLLMIPLRFINGMLYKYKRAILPACLFTASLALVYLGAGPPNPGGGWLAFALLGGCLGPVWPILMSTGAESDRKNSGLLTGMMSVGCGCGAVLLPILLGYSVDHWGIRNGFLVTGVLSVCGGLAGAGYFRSKATEVHSEK